MCRTWLLEWLRRWTHSHTWTLCSHEDEWNPPSDVLYSDSWSRLQDFALPRTGIRWKSSQYNSTTKNGTHVSWNIRRTPPHRPVVNPSFGWGTRTAISYRSHVQNSNQSEEREEERSGNATAAELGINYWNRMYVSFSQFIRLFFSWWHISWSES